MQPETNLKSALRAFLINALGVAVFTGICASMWSLIVLLLETFISPERADKFQQGVPLWLYMSIVLVHSGISKAIGNAASK